MRRLCEKYPVHGKDVLSAFTDLEKRIIILIGMVFFRCEEYM